MIRELAVGLGMFLLTMCVQAVLIILVIVLATSKHPRSLTRPSHWANFLLIQVVSLLLVLVQLVNIGLWALLFRLCGEFGDYEKAYYHSAVNYSSLGYGEMLSPRWRLLGPLEAVNGIVMFGIATALIFAVLMRLIQRRIHGKEPGHE
jgi:hypothetical protein